MLDRDMRRCNEMGNGTEIGGQREKKDSTYHPASLESAAERMQGVSIHGLWVGSPLDPILTVE